MSVNSWSVPGSLVVGNDLTVSGGLTVGTGKVIAPVQPNWTETNSTQLDYIQNAPPISATSTNGTVTGATTTGNSTVTGNQTVQGTLQAGNTTVTGLSTTGNASITGTFAATGGATISGAPLTCASDCNVSGNLKANAGTFNGQSGAVNVIGSVSGGSGPALTLQQTSSTSAGPALCCAGVANNYCTGSVAGDAVLRNLLGNVLVAAGANSTLGIKIDTSGNVTITNLAATTLTATNATVSGTITNATMNAPAGNLVLSTTVTGNSVSLQPAGAAQLYYNGTGLYCLTATPLGTATYPWSTLYTKSIVNSSVYCWKYLLNASSAANSSSNLNISVPYTLLTLQTGTGLSSGLVLGNYTVASCGGLTQGGFTVPYTGIYSLTWQARFSTTGTENALWFAPVVSAVYGETGTNSNSSRLSYASTTSINQTVTYTGYFIANDIIAVGVYCGTSGSTVVSGFSGGLTVTLIQRSA